MNKRFTKTVAATLAAMSIANVAVFADDAPVVEEAPSKITVDIEAIKAEGKILNTFGDINLDGEVTNADLLLCAKAVIGAEKLEGYNYVIADIDKDGLVTNSDLVILSRDLVGLDNKLDYFLEYCYAKAKNDEFKNMDITFPEPDYEGGIVGVRFYYAVYRSLLLENLSQEQFAKLFPGIDVEYVTYRGTISGYGAIYLKAKTKEAVKDALIKIKFSPYIESAH